MPIHYQSLVPMIHVKDVPASVAFYERFGFVCRDTWAPEGAATPTWASLESGGARLMLVRADDTPILPDQQLVMFYLYCDDAAATRAALLEAGVPCGPIERPGHAPHGEFRVEDPDRLVFRVMQR